MNDLLYVFIIYIYRANDKLIIGALDNHILQWIVTLREIRMGLVRTR